MAKLTVFKNGTKVSSHDLDQSRQYVIGRGSQSDIFLDSLEISRQHAKLSFNGSSWECSVVSKFGKLTTNGHPVDTVALSNRATFSIPPYEFRFTEETLVDDQTAPSEVVELSDRTVPTGPTPAAGETSDKTVMGKFPLKSVLVRLSKNGEPSEEITLGAGVINAGRSSKCAIKLFDKLSSRRHFSLYFDGTGFVLKDLGGPNTTKVNGKQQKTVQLHSGDEITIGSDRFRYEEVNPEIQDLRPILLEPTQAVPIPTQARDMLRTTPLHSGVPDWAQKLPPLAQQFILRIEKPRMVLALGAALVLILAFVLSGKNDTSKERKPASEKNLTPQQMTLKNLSPEQKKFLEETYNLALNFYTSGKYELASLELNKIFQIVPDYKDSKAIQQYCQQALEIEKQQKYAEQRTQEQREIQQKVNDILDECEKLLTGKKFSDVEPCVSRTAELDPENERAQRLVSAAQASAEQQQVASIAREQAIVRKKLAKLNLKSGQMALSQGRFPAAIEAFQKVARSNFYDNEGIKGKAQIGLKAAKAKLLEASTAHVQSGKKFLDDRNYKKAILELGKALQLAPDNGDAQSYMERARKELLVEMKNMYEESVIEENLGNIDSAKKKWKTIVDTCLPTDDYFKKARLKLGKYEK